MADSAVVRALKWLTSPALEESEYFPRTVRIANPNNRKFGNPKYNVDHIPAPKSQISTNGNFVSRLKGTSTVNPPSTQAR
ncbi:MAG: hypothetical protein LR011_07755 [Verrucomicrobia bacterium]|nr:hypothetical protein [Verrucomicrobiota bacterium]